MGSTRSVHTMSVCVKVYVLFFCHGVQRSDVFGGSLRIELCSVLESLLWLQPAYRLLPACTPYDLMGHTGLRDGSLMWLGGFRCNLCI